MNVRRITRDGWLVGLLSGLALGLAAAWFLVVPLGLGSGQLAAFLRRGAGSGAKLLANALVMSVTFISIWTVLRLALEDVGLLRKRDQWTDWRQTPAPGLVDGPALRDAGAGPTRRGAGLPAPAWPRRTFLRAQRAPGARTHWGFNRRQPD